MARTATKHVEESNEAKLERIGANAYRVIAEMVTAMRAADESEDQSAIEAAREAIEQDPLSVEVRGGWRNAGEMDDGTPEEFKILLGTGGPAVRIVGELNRGEVTSARLEAQDWFLPWTEYRGGPSDYESVLLNYCRCFVFGE